MTFNAAKPVDRYIICERDVGLFSLIQQVISQVHWAERKKRVPIAYFTDRNAYFTDDGYKDADNVWEYYFEPLVAGHPASSISQSIKQYIKDNPPNPFTIGYFADRHTWVSNNFGEHEAIAADSLQIPYEREDPNEELRRTCARIIHEYIRPRGYILDRVHEFFHNNMRGHSVIGVQIRGTDAVSEIEERDYRQGSLDYVKITRVVTAALQERPDAKVFVATDDEASLTEMRRAFGERIIACDSVRHQGGQTWDWGPTGDGSLPGYIARNPEQAAQNGADAVVEYLLLEKCELLIHNGASLARTVLLANPTLPCINTHAPEATRQASTLRERWWEVRAELFELMKLRPIRSYFHRLFVMATSRGDELSPSKYKGEDLRAWPRLSKGLRREIWIEIKSIPLKPWRWLYTHGRPSRRSKHRQIIKEKAAREIVGQPYIEKPRVSLIVHSFNQVENVKRLAMRLRKTLAEELIVCEDGSLDGSAEEWKELLNRPNDFLIGTNDLHEVRVLDRAIRLAKGELVCIIQDDDRPPDNGDWLELAKSLFEIYPKLGVLGGWQGFTQGFSETWNHELGRGEGPIPTLCPVLKIPFMFVDSVNIGPYFIRKSVYEHVGSFDTRYSPPGISGILFEADYCYRTWLGGFQVGLVDIPVGKLNNSGGTQLWGAADRVLQEQRNLNRLQRIYAEHQATLDRLRNEAGAGLIKRL